MTDSKGTELLRVEDEDMHEHLHFKLYDIEVSCCSSQWSAVDILSSTVDTDTFTCVDMTRIVSGTYYEGVTLCSGFAGMGFRTRGRGRRR